MLIKIILWTMPLFFLAVPVLGQEPQEEPISQDDIIRVETNLVQLRAVVTDKQGRPVASLKREDFEVLEDGHAKEIGSFSVERIDGSRTNMAEGSQSVIATARPSAARPGRVIVLFVDTFHLSASSFSRIKQQLRQIVADRITDQDLVAIVTTDGRLGALQQFTRDRKLLNYAIEKISLSSRGDSHFTPYLAAKVTSDDQDAASAAIQILMAEESYQPTNAEAALSYVRARAREIIVGETYRRRVTLETLKAVTDSLAKLQGQRILVVLSDGFTTLENGGGAATRETQAVTGRASRSGVVIYSLGAPGLTAPAEFNASLNLSGSSFVPVSRVIRNSEIDQQDVLRTLAYDTGGQAYLNTNSLTSSFQDVLDGNSINYVLGFYAPSGGDEKFRNITIRLRNHPDYKVRSAKGYVPVAGGSLEHTQNPRQRLFLAMLSPLPATELVVNASANYLERDADRAQVTLLLNLDGQSLTCEQQGQRCSFQWELAVAVSDTAGTLVRSSIGSVRADLTAEEVELARLNGFRYETRFEVKPGAYQARVGVRDLHSGLIGTANSWVQVPDLQKGQLVLSSIFLGRDSAMTQRTVGKPRLIQNKPFYKNGDIVFYRFVAYNLGSPADSELRLEILQGDKPAFTSEWRGVAEETITTNKKGLELGGLLRLGLGPGLYVFKATIVNHKSKKTAQQTTYFEVER